MVPEKSEPILALTTLFIAALRSTPLFKLEVRSDVTWLATIDGWVISILSSVAPEGSEIVTLIPFS